ncbi:mitochondrial 39-S ribosomal protein L47 (MRP-L47)-domain-containing protein [Phlebopus sp. FC_14]|nr:mitochondrial 39-S ribosomal protein L47 (MRP-L47)-domain-containing protein [Phlebopus sp. FC_14]
MSSNILQAARSLTVSPRVLNRVRWNSNTIPGLDHSRLLQAPEGAELSAVGEPGSKGYKRPHLGIKVDSNHGLWTFFRKKVKEDGTVTHETIEVREPSTSGRSWTAAELRRKSFKDLHTLWYVLLRERNLLATQREEARRMGVQSSETISAPAMDKLCRKSMARLKYVINERRLLYEQLSSQGLEAQEPAQVEAEAPASESKRSATRKVRMRARRTTRAV